MRVLCIPDLHCWYTNHARPTDDGIDSRLADWRRTANAMVELAIAQGCTLAVAPGDLYDVPRPPARAILEVARVFGRLEEAGIPVIGCNGNHDIAGPGQPGPVDLFAGFGRPFWGITAPRIVTAAGIQVAVLPWAKASALLDGTDGAGDVVQRTGEALVAIVRALAAQLEPDTHAILIGHWALSGARYSSGQYVAGGEPALPVSELTGPWRAVIMGHIHKPQVVWQTTNGPVILHTGALERRDFGEERDERGCYIVDVATGAADWHELPARRFCTVKLDDAAVEWIAGGGAVDVPLYDENGGTWDPIEGSICRVTYRATEELARRMDHGRIIRTLERLGAHQVAGVYPEIVRSERARAAGLTEQTSPAVALDMWLAQRSEYSEDLKGEARAAFRQLLEGVA